MWDFPFSYGSLLTSGFWCIYSQVEEKKAESDTTLLRRLHSLKDRGGKAMTNLNSSVCLSCGCDLTEHGTIAQNILCNYYFARGKTQQIDSKPRLKRDR